MNPFRSLVDLVLELRKEVLYRYATDSPYTPEETTALATQLKAHAADCRVAARRMGCSGEEKTIDILLQATEALFNSPARLREPYSRANNLEAAVSAVARLADDFDAESRRSISRTGRPREGETDKEQLVIAALMKHHGYQSDRSIGNPTPAKTAQLAKLASGKQVQVSDATVSRFFKKKFPGRGYKGYTNACVRGEIGMKLAVWQGDILEAHADLLSEEYGRGEDD
jgi:hypothetical protein